MIAARVALMGSKGGKLSSFGLFDEVEISKNISTAARLEMFRLRD